MDIFIGFGFYLLRAGVRPRFSFYTTCYLLTFNLQVRRYLVMLEPSPLRSYFIRSEGRALGKQEGNDKFRASGKNPVYAYLS